MQIKISNTVRNGLLIPGIWYILLSVSSCKKLIAIDPPLSTITTEEVFTSNAQANAVLAGMYSRLMNNSGSYFFSNGATSVYAGLSADELVGLNGTLNIDDYSFYSNKLFQESGIPNSLFWQPAYKLIYTANAAIAGMAASTSAALTDSAKKTMTADCKFIRAFCYFYLTNFFGDVPLPLTADFTKTTLLKKSPQADVYTQIIKDLKDAQQGLSVDFSAGLGERVRASKWAATALLARVYLYQKNWAEAEAQASAVIGNSQFSLITNLANVFLKNSTESILQFKQQNTVAPYNTTWEGSKFTPLFRWSTLLAADKATFMIPALYSTYISYLVPTYYLTPQLVSAFETNDKRKQVWTDTTPSPAVSPYFGYTYVYPYKYTTNLGSNGGAVTQYYMVLRLAEQFLIRAEARAQQNTNLSGAASDINAIRTRAGLPNTTAATQADLLTAVANERRVELFAEWGHRWFDLKRTEQASAVLSTIPVKQPWSNHQLLYPIPSLEIVNDPNLIQNPGY